MGYHTKVRESLNPGLQNAPKPPAPRWGFFMPGTQQRPRQSEDLSMGLSTTGGRAVTTRAHSLRLALYLWPQRLVLQEGGGSLPRGRDPKDCFGGPAYVTNIDERGPPYTRYGLRPLICRIA